MVDWKDGAAAPNYFTAAPNTKTVGAKTAAFLKDLGVDYSKIHCIGMKTGHFILKLLFKILIKIYYFYRSQFGSSCKYNFYYSNVILTVIKCK